MRPEIIEALSKRRALHTASTQFEGMDESDKPLTQMGSVLPKFQDELDITYRKANELIECLKQGIPIVDVFFGSPTTVNVRLNDNGEDHLIIELSLYGPLAAVFAYGQGTKDALDRATTCITDLGLIQLTADEIAELEQNDHYLDLFE